MPPSAEFQRAMRQALFSVPPSDLGEPPLDTVAHVRAALHMMHRLPHSKWPRILGAASGYGLITHSRARELLMTSRELPLWWCTACNCTVPITCPDCGADACARCWRCVTDGCGDDMPRRPPKEMTSELRARGCLRCSPG